MKNIHSSLMNEEVDGEKLMNFLKGSEDSFPIKEHNEMMSLYTALKNFNKFFKREFQAYKKVLVTNEYKKWLEDEETTGLYFENIDSLTSYVGKAGINTNDLEIMLNLLDNNIWLIINQILTKLGAKIQFELEYNPMILLPEEQLKRFMSDNCYNWNDKELEFLTRILNRSGDICTLLYLLDVEN